MQGSKYRWLSRSAFAAIVLLILQPSQQVNAGSPESPPELSCKIGRAIAVGERHFEAGNLDQLELLVTLSGNGAKREELSLSSVSDGSTGTLEVIVFSLEDKENSVAVDLGKFGAQGTIGVSTKLYLMRIPIEAEKMRDGFEKYYQRVVDTAQRTEGYNTERMLNILRDRKEYLFEYIRRIFYENEPGQYKILCKYKSTAEGYWNGQIQADPIFLVIQFEKSFYDQKVFHPELE